MNSWGLDFPVSSPILLCRNHLVCWVLARILERTRFKGVGLRRITPKLVEPQFSWLLFPLEHRCAMVKSPFYFGVDRDHQTFDRLIAFISGSQIRSYDRAQLQDRQELLENNYRQTMRRHREDLEKGEDYVAKATGIAVSRERSCL